MIEGRGLGGGGAVTSNAHTEGGDTALQKPAGTDEPPDSINNIYPLHTKHAFAARWYSPHTFS